MNTVHLICGLPGAGKTTLAKKIEEENRALRFSLDEWLITLFGRYEITPDNHAAHVERVLACRSVIWMMAERALRLGVDVILDDGFFLKEHRGQYKDLILKAGANPKLYFVDVDSEKLLTRLHNRNSDLPTNNFAIENDLMTYFFSLFEPPTSDEMELVHINNNLIYSQQSF
jgi:hypothetical protein